LAVLLQITTGISDLLDSCPRCSTWQCAHFYPLTCKHRFSFAAAAAAAAAAGNRERCADAQERFLQRCFYQAVSIHLILRENQSTPHALLLEYW
jgi:hypothetical protein